MPDGVVVLGAGGRVGRLLRAAWGNDARWQSRDPTVASPGLALNPLHEGDRLAAALRGARAVVVLSGVTTGEVDALSANLTLATAALQAADRAEVPRVLLMSSGAVYGPGGPFREDARLAPVSDYGRAKVAMERGVMEMGWSSMCILRMGNVVGADSLVGVRRASRVARLDRFASGCGPIRSYIGPVTLASCLTALCMAPTLPRVLNLAEPGPVGMETLLALAGIAWDWAPAPPGALPRVVLDTALLETVIPLPPSDPARMIDEWQSLKEGRP